MTYLAHQEDGRKQSVFEHLLGTAELAGRFAGAFGAADEGRFCGILHDVGKYSQAFQRRINGSTEHVDHSTAGALEAYKRRDIPAAFCIAGHHGGLPDGGTRADGPDRSTLMGRLTRVPGKQIETYRAFLDEVSVPPSALPMNLCTDRESALFFIRMLFSCLVDADWLDTERFVTEGKIARGSFPPLDEYRRKLNAKTAPWLASPDGEMARRRSEILRFALKGGMLAQGLFTLTAPTGSGKTISSMAFALEHAAAHGLERVIYVIPYCSIIEQTLSVFEEIFGVGNVVAHYHNAEYAHGEDGERDRRYLAAENWDAPVILTTTVQFFQSLYGKSPSCCRKLHNIARSVVIFDEAQMLPAPFLRPCVNAISQLVVHYGCSAVLCTATQPALNELFLKTAVGAPGYELCPRPKEMYEWFRRVRYESIGAISDEKLAERLSLSPRVLCIVNRRDQAQALYAKLPKEGAYHLSTAMCPADRREKLAQIRKRLLEGSVCRVVSTSLVEAGVDVDFPVVYRAMAGLDSIVQAGGRCNREGKLPLDQSVVYIFESERPAPRMLAQNISAAKCAMAKNEDPSSPEAVRDYFRELYYAEKGLEALDAEEILTLCARDDRPFEKIAERFKIIDNAQFTVYIPKKENEELLDRLERFGPTRELMRALGQYAVGVYPRHYAELGAALRPIKGMNGAAVLNDMTLYNENTGLVLTAEEGRGLFS